jgi:adenylylsulfate kinase-like enzyme
MNAGRLPVLWLYGPGGVGKTTVAWRLFTRFSADGIPTGYVDIDQVGMCYGPPTPHNWAPEPASDPGRHRLKARTLDAVLANLYAAGARCAIVSGVVEPQRGAEVNLVPYAELTLCRLRVEPAELRNRLAVRGSQGDRPDQILREADVLDRAHPGDAVVDTTGRTVADIVDSVQTVTGWPELLALPVSPAAVIPQAAPPPDPGAVLLLCGVTAVGKSSVGWEVYRRVRAAVHRAAFVDLDQIGFRRPIPASDPGNHRLKAANLAAVWRSFRGAGATCLVAVGPVDGDESLAAYSEALPAATLTVCRLHADRERLTERIALRGRGVSPGWAIPGDELCGQPPEALAATVERASVVAEALDRAGLGNLCVDTGKRPPPDVADEILSRTGWPTIGCTECS